MLDEAKLTFSPDRESAFAVPLPRSRIRVVSDLTRAWQRKPNAGLRSVEPTPFHRISIALRSQSCNKSDSYTDNSISRVDINIPRDMGNRSGAHPPARWDK